MKLLCLSSDIRAASRSIPRLLSLGIRCVVREYSNAHVGVWVQQDTDLPRALRIMGVGASWLPPWACLLDESLGAVPVVNRKSGPNIVVVQPEWDTETLTRHGLM